MTTVKLAKLNDELIAKKGKRKKARLDNGALGIFMKEAEGKVQVPSLISWY